MLQLSAVHPHTLGLLKRLMALEGLRDFTLVGGTALALQIGHRLSVDLDFFGQTQLTGEEILSIIKDFEGVRAMSSSKSINIMSIQGVKVDFVNYRYPFIVDVIHTDGVRLAGLPDIAAMKLNAVVGRGKKRDFFDLYFLLERFTMEELIGYYEAKYTDGSIFMVARSLTYFEEAEEDEAPELFDKKVTWSRVKKRLIDESRRVF